MYLRMFYKEMEKQHVWPDRLAGGHVGCQAPINPDRQDIPASARYLNHVLEGDALGVIETDILFSHFHGDQTPVDLQVDGDQKEAL